ncbi:hypothetical protein LXA43DRAFT_1098654 [Ganoderma leucocontextum]|nr:hypothetical protein LXA43DRAFT_1098654 [Ganoderma leucocontextum]
MNFLEEVNKALGAMKIQEAEEVGKAKSTDAGEDGDDEGEGEGGEDTTEEVD